MIHRPGQKMDAQSCRYCNGIGYITVTLAFVHGHRQRVKRRCHHIVGDPFAENATIAKAEKNA